MNIILSLLGWLMWNFGLFSFEKDKADDLNQDFDIRHYIKCYWDNWVLSLIMVPILIILGIKGLGLDAIPMLDIEHLKWSDSYYLGAGFFAEALKYYLAKLRKKLMA